MKEFIRPQYFVPDCAEDRNEYAKYHRSPLRSTIPPFNPSGWGAHISQSGARRRYPGKGYTFFRIPILFALLFILAPVILDAQCYPDRHNTSWTAAWVSCETARNPNPNRGQSHWAYYDFGQVYALATMHIWNLNEPDHRTAGMRTFEIDYSLDGHSWTHLGTFGLDQAPGTSIYEGEMVTDWEGIQARYVILTPTSNYGAPCVGFSEIRFNLDEQQNVPTALSEPENVCLAVQTYPNPHVDYFVLDVDSDCSDPIRYTVTNVLGQVVLSREYRTVESLQNQEIRTDHLPAGNYILHVYQGSQAISRSLIKLNR